MGLQPPYSLPLDMCCLCAKYVRMDNRSTKLRSLLREYRKAAGWTQLAISQAIGMDRTSYNRIESGARNVQRNELNSICRAIGCKPEALMREAGYTAFPEEINE